MIIWIASYPKSGNTWIRSFLYSLIFSKDGNVDLDGISKIGQYPLRSHFKGLVDEIDNIKKLAECWVSSQSKMNLDNKIKFLKTHHVMCNYENHSFTDYENTFGTIYIVRDPRNVITSLKNHFTKENYDEAKKFIMDKNKIIGRNLDEKNKLNFEDSEIFTFISSWQNHYNSWKSLKKNLLIIKYENLISDNIKEFDKIRKYLQEKLNLKFDDSKFIRAVESNSFENLKQHEENHGFKESIKDKNTGLKKKFFNLGPKNNWRNLLDNQIRIELEKNFKKEMEELGYL
tara:strand:- start:50 stop:910 length:861 start_codon:yes stop_codon:yes gene_type:complete